jgi:hypothetical protein
MGRDLFIFAMLSPAELNVRQKTQLLLEVFQKKIMMMIYARDGGVSFTIKEL